MQQSPYQADDAKFIEHTSCDCGSSDGKAVYEDHAYCFVCETYFPNDSSGGDKPSPGRKKDTRLVSGVSQAIPARALSEEACRKFGYEVGEYQGEPCHIANYRDKHGNVVAQKLRFKDKRFLFIGDTSSATLFGSHLWSKGKKLVVTEGEVDCISACAAGNLKWPTVSIPTGAAGAAKAIKANWDYVCGFEEVIIMMDADDAGRKAAQEIAELLPVGKAKIASLPFKDANEALVAGKGPAIIEAIFQARDFRPDGIVTARDFRDVIAVDEAASAVTWPYSLLNDVLRGIRRGEAVTICSGSGLGKSTFCKELIHHLLMHDQKVGILALEESNKRTLLGITGIHMSKNLLVDRSDVADDEITEAFDDLFTDKTCVLFDSFGSNQTEVICQRIQYMAKALDVDWVVLDHISILVSGNEGDDRKNLDIAMTKLRTLCQELNIGLILVSHLKRPDGRGHEDGAAVSLSQLRGSHAIAQLSDACIGIQVDPDDPDSDIRQIRILKNRYTGQTGPAGTLRYSRETGRLLEESLAALQQETEDE